MNSYNTFMDVSGVESAVGLSIKPNVPRISSKKYL
jgi:hypothetical protein